MKLKLPTTDARGGFQVWEYRVSHKQLLLRCPKTTDSSNNVDVMFYNVEYMGLPSVLPDLQIEDPDQEDIAFISSRLGKAVQMERVFVLKSGNHRHVVVAGGATVAENNMALFDSPFALPPVNLDGHK
jgi:hypothetical protein